ncbi:MAG: hypothetical protein Ct9H300mP5_4080 [Candidatus Pelagibacterales bacterium]|nr:MAG: hypothetical protein Ct9H300mP5_4080 [Pelagibacterales bacterium]
MDIEINNKIISEKAHLREKSRDFIKNFEKIESYIEREVTEIENLKNSEKSIIPEINFKELSNQMKKLLEILKKKGCVIIRDVFDDKIVYEWNKSLEEYIDKNNFFEDQKKKEGLDKYFLRS